MKNGSLLIGGPSHELVVDRDEPATIEVEGSVYAKSKDGYYRFKQGWWRCNGCNAFVEGASVCQLCGAER